MSEATGFQAAALGVGLGMACAIDLDGRAWCWGADDAGQLGQGAPVAGRCFTTVPCNRYPLPVGGWYPLP